MKRKTNKSNPKIAALQNPSIPTGYEQMLVSKCCGAKVKSRVRSGVTVAICRGCHYTTTAELKLVSANLISAYGRRPVTAAEVEDFFYRGLDYQLSPSGRYMSIRDCAQFAALQIRYGKALQKVMVLTVDHSKKR